jgi:hypothetical protein
MAVGSAQAANLVLEGDYVKIGVNEATGTLGSGGNTPPGILYDSTGTGTFNAGYDYLTPGSPFEGWALTYNSTTVYNNNAGITDLSGGVLTSYDGVAYNGTTYDNRAVWSAGHTDFDILHDYRFNNNQQIVDISTSVLAKTDMTDLYFGRFTDPDARAAAGDSSATDNVIGYGAIPVTNVVFSEAIASRYALGLYTSATNSGAAVSAGWSSDPAVYYAGGTSYGTGVNFGRGDHTIGLGFYLPTLANGSTATFSYAYIFGPSAFGAASTAVADGAGGGTPGEVPGGGTLTDVGSATDAATSGGSSTPTVTDTSTVNIVTTATSATAWASAFATTYAYATVHATPTIINNRLVVGRDNTTTETVTETQTRDVTTTTTTTPRTTTTYSDSTTTVTNGTASSTNSTATETASLAVATPTTATQTASAPTDTIDNAMLLNIYSQEMNRADPLSRINIHGEGITKRNTSTAADIARNTWMWITGKTANGNSDRSDGFEIGAERLVNDTTLIGAQYNKINSTMTGVESGSGRFDTDMINVYAVKKLGRWAVKPTVGYSGSDYDTSRVITLGAVDNFAAETYANKYSTNGKSYWADLQVIAPKVWKITPYAGLTVRKIELDGGVESGTAYTRLTYSNFSDTSSQPYVGARFDSATTERGLFYTLDGRVTKFNLADTYRYGETLTSVNSLVGYKINDRSQVTAGYQYQHADQYTNGIISIGGKLDF